MTNLKELNQQIAKVDALLQEAYRENSPGDIILFASLMTKLEARKVEHKPRKVQAWKHTDMDESRLEARILSRDEYMTIDF